MGYLNQIAHPSRETEFGLSFFPFGLIPLAFAGYFQGFFRPGEQHLDFCVFSAEATQDFDTLVVGKLLGIGVETAGRQRKYHSQREFSHA
jgi:hypothetical protein